MAIRAMSKQVERVPKVAAVCDDCGKEEVVSCDYEGRNSHDWQPNVGQAHRKMQGKGWAVIQGALRCPSCEARRKAKNIKPKEVLSMATAEPTREPTREQKRDILLMLSEVYDDKAKRYKGTETDATVADAVGGGVLWGWVAKLREEFFGPDGSEEIEAVKRDLRVLGGLIEEQSKRMLADRAAMDALAERVVDLAARVGRMGVALGPKVRT
jgi:hypothetical protein